MKMKKICLVLLILILNSERQCQRLGPPDDNGMEVGPSQAPDGQENNSPQGPDALENGPPMGMMNPFGSKKPQMTMDQNSEAEIRSSFHPLAEYTYQDKANTLNKIETRIASIPSVNDSMDKIYEKVLDHLSQINCPHNNLNGKSAEAQFIKSLLQTDNAKPNDDFSLCDQDIAPIVFMPLSNLQSTRTSIFHHFRDNIYRPLGYEFPEHRFSYTDTINDLINLDKDNSVIHKNMKGLSFANFSGIIEKAFQQIEDSSSNFDQNKGAISKQMIDILKSFHIFWNVLRQKKQIGQSKSQTLSIVKNLMNRFKQTNSAMKATTLNILGNVKDAYFRFMRANKYQELIESKPLETISFQLLERYKQNVLKIKNRDTDQYSLISEIGVFLDMLKAFHVINFHNHRTAEESLKVFQEKIFNPIVTTYNVFQDVLVQNNDNSFFKVRDFTSILLLKMKHRNYVMLNFYGLDEYMRLQENGNPKIFGNVIKFYEEIVDSVMLIPALCEKYIGASLEKCFRENLINTKESYSKKYMLTASISGVELYRYIQQYFDDIVESMAEGGNADDFNLYKTKFISIVSLFFKIFRAHFNINDMQDVEELEDNIGFQIEKAKSANALVPISLAVIDSFDKQLYNFFLNIKSSYNSYAPVTKDQRIMNSIVQKFRILILNFKSDNSKHLDEQINRLFKIVYRQAQLWVEKHSVQFVVNTHPINLAFEKSNFPSETAEKNENVNDLIHDNPVVQSSWMNPMGQQASSYTSAPSEFLGNPAPKNIV